MCEGTLTEDNTVLTCIHVLNGGKFEYVEEVKGKGVESFTCSECLELNAVDPEQALIWLRVVCKECFIECRVGNQ